MTMRRVIAWTLSAGLIAAATAIAPFETYAQAGRAGTRSAQASAVAFYEPGISPDGREIAFVSGGDIWSVAATGGAARLLVAHPADDRRPLFSPDGGHLAFVSTRTGHGDIYLLTLATGELRRLTFDDAAEMLDAWSPDGEWIYFSSSAREVSGLNDIFRIRARGGTAIPVVRDRYTNEFGASVAPDGRVAFAARGIASNQWWRHGHSHIDESELWVKRPDGKGVEAFERLVDRGAKALWPMWAPDGRAVYYVSDANGHENIWMKPLDDAPRPITSFTRGRVLWPSLSRDGGSLAFERDFGIWLLDVGTGRTARLDIVRRGAVSAPAVERVRATGDYQTLALAPDGKKVAFVARGRVFAASLADGGDAVAVTTSGMASGLSWASDSQRLVYVWEAEGATRLAVHEFTTSGQSMLTDGRWSAYAPRWSPDGRTLAYLSDGAAIRLLDLASGQDSVLSKGQYPGRFDAGQPLAWSPDGAWLAVLERGTKGFTNVHVVRVADGFSRAVSTLANTFADGVTWAPDGSFLLFRTGQRTEPGQVARIDLQPRVPRFREDRFRELFEQEPGTPGREAPEREAPDRRAPERQSPDRQAPEREVPERRAPRREPVSMPPSAPEAAPRKSGGPRAPASKPAAKVDIVFEGIRQRVSYVPMGLDVASLAVTPDGKWLVVSARAAGQQNLYAWSLDELQRERPVARQLTTTATAKAGIQATPDSKEIVYLDAGKVRVVDIAKREARGVELTAELDADFGELKVAAFDQAWALMRDLFYDEHWNGVDWAGERERLRPYVLSAATPDEWRRHLSLMIGELNASHLGISGDSSGVRPQTGRLGLDVDWDEYAEHGRVRVASLVPLGPAALAGGIRPGDYLVSLGGTRLDAATNLEAVLQHTIGKRLELGVSPTPDGAAARTVVVKPVDLPTERGLRYRAWVEERRAYVERVSGGRLGYVHLPDMGAGSLDQLHVDLDAENHGREGVVIDIRNNNGGFVNAYVLDVFSRRPYLGMTMRGGTMAPARAALGQRALERPTVLVTNQHSLSDAEDLTEGYRALGLGKVVGEPTAGWIIYTWNARLVDGSVFRLPRVRITGADGKDMENNPRPVDVSVTRPLGEDATGRDSQLDVAVRTLLDTLDADRAPNRAR